MELPYRHEIESFGERLHAPLRSYGLAVIVLLSSLLVVGLYWRNAQQRELDAARAEFKAETEAIAELLRQRLNTYDLVLRGGVSLFAASAARPSAQQWRDYVEALNIATYYPDMMGLGYAPWLDSGHLQMLQLELRDAGQGFYVVRPAGVREFYGPILYLEPRTPENIPASGYDMFSEPVRRATMTAARDEGAIRISGRVHLVQDSESSPAGLIMYAPVYRYGIRATRAARRQAFVGWVYVPLRVESFVQAALRTTPRRVALRIVDRTDGTGLNLYADQAPRGSDLFTSTMPLDAYGRHWELGFSADQRAALDGQRGQLRVTLAAGVFASLLLFGIALALARTESLAELKAARLSESYQRSELRFRNTMRFSAIGMALLDNEGRIVDANPALASIFGTNIEALVGSAFGRRFVDGDESTVRSREMRALNDGVYRTTRDWRQPDGELRHAQLAYAPVPGEIGQDVASLVQVEDITELVRTVAREQALNRTLETRVALRTRELTQANHELESFAYGVSHDLRAPLRTIDGFSRLIEERYGAEVGEEGKDFLARVRNGARRMDELIDALLKMSRVSRGALVLAPLDLSRIAREVIAELRLAEPQRSVEVDIQPELHAVGDAALVRNLLQNLIGNAWKFTGATVDARIQVGREDEPGEQARFFVRDNGAGFAGEYADKLFRPFQRLHDAQEFDGNGIGLASVKRIVERHGGEVGAEGSPGRGATFRFTLPRHMPVV